MIPVFHLLSHIFVFYVTIKHFYYKFTVSGLKDKFMVYYRWSGRLHREKIHTPVMFDEVLDMKPFCDSVSADVNYRLTGVVIHHGTGFKSGHYTANCWNPESGKLVTSNILNFPVERSS